MRIDAYTHFFPKKFFDTMNEVAGQYKDMGKRVRGIPPLYDLDARKKIIDNHKDYAQIIAYPQPPIERLAKNPQQIDEFCRIINDGFAELCAKESQYFPGWIAQVSLDASNNPASCISRRRAMACTSISSSSLRLSSCGGNSTVGMSKEWEGVDRPSRTILSSKPRNTASGTAAASVPDAFALSRVRPIFTIT